MSSVVRLRVLVDTEGDENIFRDIEILANSTFQELHLSIQEHFGFDNSQMASFYESDEEWERGEEITLMDMSMDDNSKVRLMQDTVIGEIFNSANQKMLYIFDFLLMWTFFVEVVSIGEANSSNDYPSAVLAVGENPDQYSKTPEDLFGAMKSEMAPGSEPEDDMDDDMDMDFDNNYPSY